MAEVSVSPTEEELVIMAEEIKNRISSGLNERNETLTNTLTSVRSAIDTIANIISELDRNIKELMESKQSSSAETQKVREELDTLKSSRNALMGALKALEDTYNQGMATMKTEMEGIANVPRELATRVQEPLSRLSVGLGSGEGGPAAPAAPAAPGSSVITPEEAEAMRARGEAAPVMSIGEEGEEGEEQMGGRRRRPRRKTHKKAKATGGKRRSQKRVSPKKHSKKGAKKSMKRHVRK